MTITLDLKPEIEESLAAKAKERGVSLEAYLQEIVSEQAHCDPVSNATHAKVPKVASVHLGDLGSLRRCEIYGDVQEIAGEQVHLAEAPTIGRDKIPQIPIRHLGEVGSLRREDIYDDID